jgi:hypothetical protein
MIGAQTCYAITRAAAVTLTPAGLAAIFEHWVQTGATPAGVKIDVKMWGKPWSQDRIRRHLQETGERPLGCPGIVRYYAHPNLTLCDYDTAEAPSSFLISDLVKDTGRRVEWAEYHRTRRGWHLAIYWARPMAPGEQLAIQYALGSDPGRERFNLVRLLRSGGRPGRRWNLLFETKL